MIIRRATAEDVPTIVELRERRAEWLASLGSDQWQETGLDRETFKRRVRDSIAAGETWMATEDDGAVLGTACGDQHANPGLWSAEELRTALIIHRMISYPEAAGQGVGGRLLDHLAEVAEQRGLDWLRLDAWTTNTDLHAYYQHLGFRLVRIVPDYSTRSAALFERPASYRHYAELGATVAAEDVRNAG